LTIHDIGDSATVNVRLSALEEDPRRPECDDASARPPRTGV